MNKKDLKFYEAPMAEVVELKACNMICASPGQNDGDVQDEFNG